MKKKCFLPLVVVAVIMLVGAFAVRHSFAACNAQCVKYIKYAKPAYNKMYHRQKDNCRSSKTSSWVAAKDIWLSLCTKSRGKHPLPGSVLILDQFGNNPYGHAAIVTEVRGNKIMVRHSNWDQPNTESEGYFTLINDSEVEYIALNGATSVTSYPMLGFIYEP